jgi:Flp pilus assembly protein TadD
VAELARGAVGDRPWGRTLAAIGLRGVSGQLALAADNKRYLIAFAGGAVVGAASPMASDAAVRVALTGGLLSSTQVADVSRRQAAAPQRDEIELIAELVRLTPEQALRLRRRTIAQRAARTFSIERGDFVVDDQLTLPRVAGSELDVRSVIYLGARQNLSEVRLEAELAQFGSWFRIKPDAINDVMQFGFVESDRPVIDQLLVGATLPELDATNVEPRTIRAMVYALVSSNVCELRGASRTGPPVPPKSTADGSGFMPAMPAKPDSIPRRAGPTSRPPNRRRTDSAQASDVNKVIKQRIELLRKGVDHFTLLGVAMDARPDDVRKAYFALARQLHPDRLSALGIADETREAQRLFAEVNTAFTVLSDPKRRADYADIQRRGGEAAIRADQRKAELLATRLLEAEDSFRRGEMALRRDQLPEATAEFARAVELDPDEADYAALLAWVEFCAAPDKLAAGGGTRTTLERAASMAPRAFTARFYLGRVERILGRDQEALRHFQEVLRLSPHHTEASTEVRVLEARLAASSGDKPTGGFFNRKR